MTQSGDDRSAVSGLLDSEVELFVSGRAEPGAVPDGYASVARLLATARNQPLPDCAGPPPVVLTALRQSSLAASTNVEQRRPARARGARRARTMAIGLGVATVLTGSAAAAATGSLPGPAQAVVATALSHVGVSIARPSPAEARTPTAHGAGGATASAAAQERGQRPGAQTPAAVADAHGLCTALAAGGDPNGTALRAFVADHGGDVATSDYCRSISALGPGAGTDNGGAGVGPQAPPSPPGQSQASPGSGGPPGSAGGAPNGNRAGQNPSGQGAGNPAPNPGAGRAEGPRTTAPG